jgi:Na+/H+ antiporter NhaC
MGSTTAHTQTRRRGIGLAVFGLLCVAAYFAEPAGAGVHWYSIAPPLLAIVMAYVTGRTLRSLLAAAVVGGLLYYLPGAWTSPLAYGQSLLYVPRQFFESLTDFWNLRVLVFIALILMMVSVLMLSGGMIGLVRRLTRWCRGPRSTQFVTALFGVGLFIDDYASAMIVGNAMRPLTDAKRISREKLAFLVDSTSAPIAGVAIVSSWVGYEIGLFSELSETLSLDLNGLQMLLQALPFRFYCFFLLFYVFASIALGRDFGPMARAERRAREEGEVAAEDAKPLSSGSFRNAEAEPTARIHARSALIPLGIMLVVLFGGIWWDGGGWARMSGAPLSFFSPWAWVDVLSASESAVMWLVYAALAGLVSATVCAVAIAGLSARATAHGAATGLRSSLLPWAILLLAWALKGACDDLGTAEYLVALLSDRVSPGAFPSLVFFIATLTSFATGTSYGTMGILLPIAIPVAHTLDGGAFGFATIASLAAVLDGAIFGDH